MCIIIVSMYAWNLSKDIVHQSRQISVLRSKRRFEKMFDANYDPYPLSTCLESNLLLPLPLPLLNIQENYETRVGTIECILVGSQECMSHAYKKLYHKTNERISIHATMNESVKYILKACKSCLAWCISGYLKHTALKEFHTLVKHTITNVAAKRHE